jgi:glycosyltransferase involved in cell wall biosynthesis
MNLKKIINQFNKKNTMLVVSGWPSDHTNSKHSGVSTLTCATVLEIAKKLKQKIVVLAEMNGDNKPLLLADGKVLVLRVFNHKKISLFPVILKWLFKFNKIKQVTVHSEFSANGSKKHFFLNLPFLAMIRLVNRKVKFYAHNVVDRLDEVAPHFNLGDSKIKVALMNIFMKFYYLSLGLVVNEVVVLSPVLKKRILKYVLKKKASYQFHPVWQQTKRVNKEDKLRKELGIANKSKVLMYFGFVTWYKGADWLVKSFHRLSRIGVIPNWHLVIAGGASFTLTSKSYYRKYYDELIEIAKNNPNISISGFVPDNQVGNYFKLADLLMFPYRSIIGASGCMAQAIAYKKPFVMSEKLLAKTDDKVWEEALNECKLDRNDIGMKLNRNNLAALLSNLDDKKTKKLELLANKLAKKLSVSAWVDEYENKIRYSKKRVNTWKKAFKQSSYAFVAS